MKDEGWARSAANAALRATPWTSCETTCPHPLPLSQRARGAICGLPASIAFWPSRLVPSFSPSWAGNRFRPPPRHRRQRSIQHVADISSTGKLQTPQNKVPSIKSNLARCRSQQTTCDRIVSHRPKIFSHFKALIRIGWWSCYVAERGKVLWRKSASKPDAQADGTWSVPATFLAIRKHLLAASDQFAQNPAHPKFLYTLHPEECTPSFFQRFLQSDTCLVGDSYPIVRGKKCPKRFSESLILGHFGQTSIADPSLWSAMAVFPVGIRP